MSATTSQQRVNHRAAFSSFGMANKQPVPLSDGTWANAVFANVIVIISELRAMRAVVKRTSLSPTPFIHFAVAAMSW